MMPLFVWQDPYSIDQGHTLCVVVAADLETAMRIASESNPDVRLSDKPNAWLEAPTIAWFEIYDSTVED